MSYPMGPYSLVTVNNVPERAQKLVGRVVEIVKDRYVINHVANAENPEIAESVIQQHHPDIVVCPPALPCPALPVRGENKGVFVLTLLPQFTASMWTPEQSDSVLSRARETNPAVKTLALPQGLQVERGPDAVVDYIVGKLEGLIEG
ncbi:hypothetical protein Q7P37_010789 [Cladosporium fusiforme]